MSSALSDQDLSNQPTSQTLSLKRLVVRAISANIPSPIPFVIPNPPPLLHSIAPTIINTEVINLSQQPCEAGGGYQGPQGNETDLFKVNR